MMIVDNISLSIGHKLLIKPLSLSIPKGSFMAVIGPNGAGKSLFVKIMAGLIKPSSGSISIDGQNIALLSPIKKAQLISYLAPYNIENASFTALETVISGLYPLNGQFINQSKLAFNQAMGYLEQFNLAPLANQSFASLSQGEKAQVLLCRSLMSDSPYLIIDEISANLDFGQEDMVFKFLKQLSPQKTIIAVVHHLSLASRYASHLTAIKEGEVLESGPSTPLFTAKLIKECFGFDVNLVSYSDGNGYHVELKK